LIIGFRPGRAARFPRHHDIMAARSERFGKKTDLRRLACTLAALEAYE